jgi:hypothetical protein
MLKEIVEEARKDFRLLEMLYLATAKTTGSTAIQKGYYSETIMWNDVKFNMKIRYKELSEEEFSSLKEKLILLTKDRGINLLFLSDEKKLLEYSSDIFKEKIKERVNSLDEESKRAFYIFLLLRSEGILLPYFWYEISNWEKKIETAYKMSFNESIQLDPIELLIKIGILSRSTWITSKRGDIRQEYAEIPVFEEMIEDLKTSIEKELKIHIPRIDEFVKKYNDNLVELMGVEYLLHNKGECKRNELREFLWSISLESWNIFESYPGIITSKEEEVILLNPLLIKPLKEWVKSKKDELRSKKLEPIKDLVLSIENIDNLIKYDEEFGIYKGFIVLPNKQEINVIIAPFYMPYCEKFLKTYNLIVVTEHKNLDELCEKLRGRFFNIHILLVLYSDELKYCTSMKEDKLSEELFSLLKKEFEKKKSGKPQALISKEEIEKVPPKTLEKEKWEIKNNSLYLGRNHWELFQKFIGLAEKEIRLATANLSPEALSAILKNMRKNVKLRVINNRGSKNNEIKKIIIPDKNWKRFKQFHAKFCVIDDKVLLVGSSNVTETSLGSENREFSSFFEAEILVTDKEIIKDAVNLFDIIWNEKKDISILQTNSNFISSAYGIPTQLLNLFREAKNEVVIIVPALFDDGGKLLKCLREEYNPKVKIKIITHHEIPKNYVEEVKKLQEQNTELIFVEDRIHCKIYVFDWEKAVISSANLSKTSWCFSLESGILTSDENVLEKIKNQVKTWESKRTEMTEGEKVSEPPEDEKETLPSHELPFEVEGRRIKFIEKIESKAYEEGKEKEVIHKPPTRKNIIKTPIKPRHPPSLYPSLVSISESLLAGKKYATDRRRKSCHDWNVEILKGNITTAKEKIREVFEKFLGEKEWKKIDVTFQKRSPLVIGGNKKLRIGKGFSKKEVEKGLLLT